MVITLNIGGKKFQTLRATLMKQPNTYFTRLFNGETPAHFDSEGNHFIDRDGELFAYILGWLRTEKLEYSSSVSLSSLKDEASFYGLRIPLPTLPNSDMFRIVNTPVDPYSGDVRMKSNEMLKLLNHQAREGFFPTPRTLEILNNNWGSEVVKFVCIIFEKKF